MAKLKQQGRRESEDQSIATTHTLGRTPSPNPESSQPSAHKSKVEKRKRKSPPKSSLNDRLQDMSPDEFLRHFRLHDQMVTVTINCRRNGCFEFDPASSRPAYSLPRKLLLEKSAYFNAIFNDKGRKFFNVEIKAREATEAKEAFEAIIQYMYTGKITLPDFQGSCEASEALTKYLQVIKLSTLFRLDSDLLARNAGTIVWGIIRKNPSAIERKHVNIIVSREWPEGWSFDNVKKELVKDMAQHWSQVMVGAQTGKERKYDLAKILESNKQANKLILGAVGDMLWKRAEWTGLDPMTGKVLPEYVEEEGEEYEEAEEDDEYEGSDESEGNEDGEDEEDADEDKGSDEDPEAMDAPVEDESSELHHELSEKGRFWEVARRKT